MVGADLHGLVATHDKTGLLVLLVLEKANVTSPALLPLLSVSVEAEKLSAHLEDLFFLFFVRHVVDLFGQMNNRVKVDVLALLNLVLLRSNMSVMSLIERYCGRQVALVDDMEGLTSSPDFFLLLPLGSSTSSGSSFFSFF